MTVCLNMIVKDEAHIIEKTLNNLCDKIKFDYWVISDTGSTDDTPNIITSFFSQKSIKGELHHDEWKNFGHNRTLALEHAYDKTDLLFIFDADDILVGNIIIPDKPEFDAYQLIFEKDIYYWRILLVNNRKKWRFRGVLHEYIVNVDAPITQTFYRGDYHIVHGVTGARSKVEDKYIKDAIVFENELKNMTASHPDWDLRHRYTFYCGNSYRDGKNFEKAIEWYKKTIKGDGWIQERYVACMSLYNIYAEREEFENAMYYAVESFQFDPKRVEGVQKVIQHYVAKEVPVLAYMYYSLIKYHYETEYLQGKQLEDKLFTQSTSYDFFLPYYMIIIADRLNMRDMGVMMYRHIFTKKVKADQWFIDHLTKNLKYFKDHIKDHIKEDRQDFYRLGREYIKFLEENNYIFTDEFYHYIFEIGNTSI